MTHAEYLCALQQTRFGKLLMRCPANQWSTLIRYYQEMTHDPLV